MQATLDHLIAACEGHGTTDACPILNALEDASTSHHDQTHD
jgi:hypothetical protein